MTEQSTLLERLQGWRKEAGEKEMDKSLCAFLDSLIVFEKLKPNKEYSPWALSEKALIVAQELLSTKQGR